jgi:hypothetical protein
LLDARAAGFEGTAENGACRLGIDRSDFAQGMHRIGTISNLRFGYGKEGGNPIRKRSGQFRDYCLGYRNRRVRELADGVTLRGFSHYDYRDRFDDHFRRSFTPIVTAVMSMWLLWLLTFGPSATMSRASGYGLSEIGI